MLALLILLGIFAQSCCQKVVRPNIVMVMSDAFVSMKQTSPQLNLLELCLHKREFLLNVKMFLLIIVHA